MQNAEDAAFGRLSLYDSLPLNRGRIKEGVSRIFLRYTSLMLSSFLAKVGALFAGGVLALFGSTPAPTALPPRAIAQDIPQSAVSTSLAQNMSEAVSQTMQPFADLFPAAHGVTNLLGVKAATSDATPIPGTPTSPAGAAPTLADRIMTNTTNAILSGFASCRAGDPKGIDGCSYSASSMVHAADPSIAVTGSTVKLDHELAARPDLFKRVDLADAKAGCVIVSPTEYRQSLADPTKSIEYGHAAIITGKGGSTIAGNSSYGDDTIGASGGTFIQYNDSVAQNAASWTEYFNDKKHLETHVYCPVDSKPEEKKEEVAKKDEAASSDTATRGGSSGESSATGGGSAKAYSLDPCYKMGGAPQGKNLYENVNTCNGGVKMYGKVPRLIDDCGPNNEQGCDEGRTPANYACLWQACKKGKNAIWDKESKKCGCDDPGSNVGGGTEFASGGTFSGGGAADQAQGGGGGGSGTSGKPDTSAGNDAEVRKRLADANIKIKEGKSVDGLGQRAVDGLVNTKKACPDCDIFVTGGTESGHLTHGAGMSNVDVRYRDGSALNNYILGSNVGTRTGYDGAGNPGTVYVMPDGSGWFQEALDTPNVHWHVMF